MDIDKLKAMAEQLGDNAGSVPLPLFAKTVVALVARLDAIERRSSAREKQRTMVFEGAHDPARSYKAGAVTQRSGSLFVALVDSTDVPGESGDWRRIGVSK